MTSICQLHVTNNKKNRCTNIISHSKYNTVSQIFRFIQLTRAEFKVTRCLGDESIINDSSNN